MDSAIFVLIMVFTTGSSSGGITIVQQEFSSYATCEHAREAIAKAHNKVPAHLVSQGCYKK